MVQGLDWSDSLIGVYGQHLLQQVDELPPVRLLHQHVTPFQICGHVHLQASGGKLPRFRWASLAPSLLFCALQLHPNLLGHLFPTPRMLCLPRGGGCHGSSLPAGHGCSLCRRGWGGCSGKREAPVGTCTHMSVRAQPALPSSVRWKCTLHHTSLRRTVR